MILPSRLTIAACAATAILLPVSIWTSWNWGVANRLHSQLDAEVNTPKTGMRFKYAACEAERGNLEARIERQNRAVQDLKAESDRRTAAADRAIAEARRAQQTAEARSRAIRNQQPRPGEGLCEAADRIIVEAVS
ncbi:hypothetical protein ACFPIF_15580 [Brevundimonas faecalis]|uniref:hypothetical protein n=1 Tax=Brevundimonas faecalis TaxID=947378 RepID=UPI00361B31F5